MNAMRKKALVLAENDFNVNGSYINSPYKMNHNAEHYKVFVRREPKNNAGRQYYLEIIRPQQVVTTEILLAHNNDGIRDRLDLVS